MLKASAPGSFSEALISAYRGWYSFVESQSGWEPAKYVLINDLSQSKVEAQRFESLAQVRDVLERLLAQSPDAKTTERIQQSLFFLEQRPGDKATREAVLKRGIPWREVSDGELDGLHGEFQRLRANLVAAGALTEEEARRRYERRRGDPGAAEDIRERGQKALDGFQRWFPRLAPGVFDAEEVVSPAPWSNLVTQERGRLRLVANRGELSDLSESRRAFLALHEVGGHVLHFSQLLRDEELRAAAPHQLCLAVHTYDAYFIEGIAQFLTSVYLARIAAQPTTLHLDVKRNELWLAVRHKNLTDLIEGTIDPERAAERERAYLGGEAAALRKVYEGICGNIFFCCQMLVYYPSHQALLPALSLEDEALRSFVGRLLRGHHSPQGLDELVRGAVS